MKNLLIVFVFLVVIIILMFSLNCKNLENFANEDEIPKIIHQTAPADKSKWKKEWFDCQETWKKYFPEPEYKHIMWTDEDLDDFMKNEFPEDYPIFKKYDKNIKRIDMARCYYLYKYGGIYADMDYKCFKNFLDKMPTDKVSIVESPYPWEKVQNALMISPKGHNFWKKVIEESKNRTDSKNILWSTGPILVSDIYYLNKDDVNLLPVDKYNPIKDAPTTPDMITRHLGTYSWEKDAEKK